MAKASDLSPSESQRVLIYGPPKVGKTKLALALAEHFNIIYFGLEAGHAVVFQLPRAWQERIEIIDIPDSRTFPVGSETMMKVIKGGEHSICEMHGKVACFECLKRGGVSTKVHLSSHLGKDTVVIIDSLTQLTTSMLAHITKDQDDLYKPQTDDWGNLAALTDIFLSNVQQSKFHIICISHETETKLVDGKTRVVPVSGSRNSSRNTAKYFDHVVYAQVTNGAHSFGSSTLYAAGVVTGSRTGATIETMPEASLLGIMRGEVKTFKSPTPGQVAAGSLEELASMISAKDNPLNRRKQVATVAAAEPTEKGEQV